MMTIEQKRARIRELERTVSMAELEIYHLLGLEEKPKAQGTPLVFGIDTGSEEGDRTVVVVGKNLPDGSIEIEKADLLPEDEIMDSTNDLYQREFRKAQEALDKKFPFYPEEISAPSLDIFEIRSNCCDDKVIQRGGDEGTNHYECMRCGDATDVHREGAMNPEDGAPYGDRRFKSQRIKRKPKTKKPCCGSGNWKHKTGCTGEVETDPTRPKKYDCDDCGKQFQATTEDAAICECGSSNCWPVRT